MKSIYPILFCLLFLSCFTSPTHAQTLQEYTGATVSPGGYLQSSQGQVDVTCLPDTVAYPNGKATSLRLLSVNTSTSGQSLYQYYDCPQPITIYGFDFFGYTPSFGGQIDVVCELYLTDTDSLPIGSPLASDTITVDSAAGGLTLGELRKEAIFDTPVTLDEPYILVFTNPNVTNFSIVCNDWTLFDGGFEWLSGADFRNVGGSWTRGYDVNVGLSAFNADVFLHPYVEYDMTPLFSADQTCFSPSTTVQYTNYTSPIVNSRMYNTLVFNFTGTEYSWNFGDGSPANNLENPSHTFTTAGPYTTVMTASIFGWANVCVANYGVPMGPAAGPNAEFIANQNGAFVDFTNVTSGGTSYVWDFGDGSPTSTLTSPSHFYAQNGTYVASLTATSACGSQTQTDTIVVNCDAPQAFFSWANSGLLVNFSDSSQNATGWEWNFGDGSGTSTQANPTYIYSNFGTYEVTLIVSSPCGFDTLRDSVAILDPSSLTPAFGPATLALYPNPGTGVFTLAGELEGHEKLEVILYSLEGKQLTAWKKGTQKHVDFTFDLSRFESGTYLLEIRGERSRSMRKLSLIH